MPTKYYTLSSTAKKFNLSVEAVVTFLKSKGYKNIKNEKTARINQKQYEDVEKNFTQNAQTIELKLVEKFDDNINQWFIGRDNYTEAKIESNKYIITGIDDTSCSTIKTEESDFDNSDSYSITATIDILKANKKAFFGIIWASDSNRGMNIFFINALGQFIVGCSDSTGNIVKEQIGQLFKLSHKSLEVKIEKQKQQILYCINNEEVFSTSKQIDIYGKEVGFILEAGIIIECSYLCIVNKKPQKILASVPKKSVTVVQTITPKEDAYRAVKTDATFIEVKYNSKHITYKRLFERHLKDVKKIEVHDPYLRQPHQIKNLIEFCHLIYNVNKFSVELHLITTESLKRERKKQGVVDNDKVSKESERTQMMFYNLKKSLDNEGKIKFSYDFKPDSAFHARKIIIDDTKLILLDRGLDIYQYYDLSSIESERQESRKSKGFYMVVLDNIKQYS